MADDEGNYNALRAQQGTERGFKLMNDQQQGAEPQPPPQLLLQPQPPQPLFPQQHQMMISRMMIQQQ